MPPQYFYCSGRVWKSFPHPACSCFYGIFESLSNNSDLCKIFRYQFFFLLSFSAEENQLLPAAAPLESVLALPGCLSPPFMLHPTVPGNFALCLRSSCLQQPRGNRKHGGSAGWRTVELMNTRPHSSSRKSTDKLAGRVLLHADLRQGVQKASRIHTKTPKTPPAISSSISSPAILRCWLGPHHGSKHAGTSPGLRCSLTVPSAISPWQMPHWDTHEPRNDAPRHTIRHTRNPKNPQACRNSSLILCLPFIHQMFIRTIGKICKNMCLWPDIAHKTTSHFQLYFKNCEKQGWKLQWL